MFLIASTTETNSANQGNDIHPPNSQAEVKVSGASVTTSVEQQATSNAVVAKKEPTVMPQLSTAVQLPKKLPSLNSPPKSRLAPVTKPVGIDPVEIMKEREYRYIFLTHSCT